MKPVPVEYRCCQLSSYQRECILPEGVPTPADYLSFARTDLSEPESDRSRINSYANCKRAVHLQLSTILGACGFEKASKGSFPPQLALAQRCGIVVPAIVGKLNRLRNEVEHSYYVPTKEETGDAVDIAELFLKATERFTNYFPTDVELCSDYDEVSPVEQIWIRLITVPGSGVIGVTTQEYRGPVEALVTLAATIRAERDSAAAHEAEIGVKPAFVGDPEEAAFGEAWRRLKRDSAFEVSVAETPLYEAWVAYLLEFGSA